MSKNKSVRIGSHNVNESPIKSARAKIDNTKKITIDLSFDGLLCCTEINEFSNYYQTASSYIEFMKIVNIDIYHELSSLTMKEFIGKFCPQFRHTHIVGSDKISAVQDAVKSSLLKREHTNADDIIKQNIKDAVIYQIGVHASSGRIFGVFKDDSIFMPILYDPNHLIYKSKIGHERRFTNVNVCTFDPYSFSDFKYPVRCLRCGENKEKKLIEYKKDIGLKKSVYICESCYLSMIDSNEVKK